MVVDAGRRTRRTSALSYAILRILAVACHQQHPLAKVLWYLRLSALKRPALLVDDVLDGHGAECIFELFNGTEHKIQGYFQIGSAKPFLLAT